VGLKVSPAGNRNGFTGMAVPDDAVVIDLSHMRTVGSSSSSSCRGRSN